MCTRFVLKNYLTAIYTYIPAENSSTGCTSIHLWVCKMLWYCSVLFYFESVQSIVNQTKNNNIFTGLNIFFKAVNFRFWQVSQSFDYSSDQPALFLNKYHIERQMSIWLNVQNQLSQFFLFCMRIKPTNPHLPIWCFFPFWVNLVGFC